MNNDLPANPFFEQTEPLSIRELLDFIRKNTVEVIQRYHNVAVLFEVFKATTNDTSIQGTYNTIYLDRKKRDGNKYYFYLAAIEFLSHQINHAGKSMDEILMMSPAKMTREEVHPDIRSRIAQIAQKIKSTSGLDDSEALAFEAA